MKRPARVPSQLSQSLNQRVHAYALAASAAGVGALALTQPAQAKIVYTPAHIVIGNGGVHYFQLDINHDGVTDMSFFTMLNGCTSGCFAELYAQFPVGNQVRGQKAELGVYYVSALRSGMKIGDAGMHTCRRSSWCAMANSGTGLYGPFGKWLNVKDRYVGLKFDIKGKLHFGWARLNVVVKPTRVRAVLTGYAYETIANKPIIAGQTHGRDEATLGRLAQGASGVSNGGKP
jgi:hypothetical protein